MAFDYTGVMATAKTLIDSFGRDMTLVIRDTNPADAAKPWRGPASPGTDITLVAKGVVVNPSSSGSSFFGTEYVNDAGKLIRRTDKAILFAENAVSGITMKNVDKIIDGADTYRVDRVNVLEPGGSPIIYEMDIKK